ncbi:MAG: flavodoxin family protein [Coriobacteriales bacterium]|jgi:multimeric flavodoxin WrbA|nr:flavodoxin family protein [Coriobacteriales bacterium]
MSTAPDILFISGSPRAHACESLVNIIESGARTAGARSQRFMLSKKHISPCTGCNACNKTGVCVLANRTAGDHLLDDYLELKAVMERVDALALVAPLFFAGPPAQLKALFDRMQPYWTQRYILGQPPRPKRPAQLFIVGGGDAYGHDPHGHEPLVGIARSALAVAGFSLEKVHNFVGFRAGSDRPVLPGEDASERPSMGELAQLKRAVAAQADFEQRARDAGGALARFVVWSRATKLGAEASVAPATEAAATAESVTSQATDATAERKPSEGSPMPSTEEKPLEAAGGAVSETPPSATKPKVGPE